MSSIYDRLGVPTLINASGPATRLSGSLLPPEVVEAMVEASQYCVDMTELQARACQLIAEITRAEAGYVTSGASAALLLGTAACVTGLDPSLMGRLPDVRGMKNEVIIARSQRNSYDHAVRSVGINLVEVGIPDRFSGAGIRDAEAWEIADAITEKTAAVYYVATPRALPLLEEVVQVCRSHQVPVLVDAAGQLPPASNLRKFIAQGADLVAFSGGKAIRGPQSTGILCGRQDLISSAALQHLDLDVLDELWNPPQHLIDRDGLSGIPHNGIGRPCKVGKEEIVGLLTALQRFVAEDPEIRRSEWMGLLQSLIDSAGALERGKLTLIENSDGSEVPVVELELVADADFSALSVMRALQESQPSILVSPSRVREGILVFSPQSLREEDPPIIGRRLRLLMSG